MLIPPSIFSGLPWTKNSDLGRQIIQLWECSRSHNVFFQIQLALGSYISKHIHKVKLDKLILAQELRGGTTSCV